MSGTTKEIRHESLSWLDTHSEKQHRTGPPDVNDVTNKHKEYYQLKQQIEHYEKVYRAGSPEITDHAFDDLVDRGKELENELNVPAQERIGLTPGSDQSDGFKKIQHRLPMLSLEKVSPSQKDKTGQPIPLIEQITSWYEQRKTDIGIAAGDPMPLVVEPKIDGMSVSLLYVGGKLRRALTRGDGNKGDDITQQVLAAKAVPTVLTGVDGTLEARGELYWPVDAFNAHNARKSAINEQIEAINDQIRMRNQRTGPPHIASVRLLETVCNPRNGCAGLIKKLLKAQYTPEKKTNRSLDEETLKLKEMANTVRTLRREFENSELASAGLSSFLYQIPWSENVALPQKQSEMLKWLLHHGANVYIDEVFLAENAAQAFHYCDEYAKRRESLGFDIDGMVIKIDDLGMYEQLREPTSHHPHWAIAYKFAPERKPTILRNITAQVGKSGRLTPVANLKPITISGTTVSQASLMNFPEIIRKDIRIGDTVFVEKAGDIIPQVVGVDTNNRPASSTPYTPPTQCPSCHSELIVEEVFVYCPNPSCPDQIRERLSHFCSRSAMEIDWLDDATLEMFSDTLNVTSPDALFRLDRQEIEAIETGTTKTGKTRLLGKKTSANIINSIEAAKNRGLDRVLVGLAIRHVGPTTADQIAKYFKNVDELLEFASRYANGDRTAIDLVAPENGHGAIDGIARATADSIFTELNSAPIRRVLYGLREAGVRLDMPDRQTKTIPGVTDKIFVITGNLSTMKREEASKRIRDAGGTVASSVSKHTNYVVAGDNAGKKLENARKLGVMVISEEQLREKLQLD